MLTPKSTTGDVEVTKYDASYVVGFQRFYGIIVSEYEKEKHATFVKRYCVIQFTCSEPPRCKAEVRRPMATSASTAFEGSEVGEVEGATEDLSGTGMMSEGTVAATQGEDESAESQAMHLNKPRDKEDEGEGIAIKNNSGTGRQIAEHERRFPKSFHSLTYSLWSERSNTDSALCSENKIRSIRKEADPSEFALATFLEDPASVVGKEFRLAFLRRAPDAGRGSKRCAWVWPATINLLAGMHFTYYQREKKQHAESLDVWANKHKARLYSIRLEGRRLQGDGPTSWEWLLLPKEFKLVFHPSCDITIAYK